MTLHGCCTNPTGARGYHNLCPATWPSWYGDTHHCDCDCHTEKED